MKRPSLRNQTYRRPLRIAATAAILICAVLLLRFGQPLAAALVPLIGLLFAEIGRRDRRAHALAGRIAGGRLAEKIEVRHGEWGELSQAINGLLQERRIRERLRAVQPDTLPQEVAQAFLCGALPLGGQARHVAVMLVRHTARARDVAGAVGRWQALTNTAHAAAQRHGALLQPCGDALLLAFGAFEDRPAAESLRCALAAADALAQGWRAESAGAGGPLTISLVCGQAIAAALPGLGYCVLGPPIEQAMRLQQLALSTRRHGLLCSEDVYRTLRGGGSAWRPTDLRIPSQHRPPQMVYELAAP